MYMHNSPNGLTRYLKNIHPRAAEHTFFPSVHITFSGTDHILGHKTSLKKLKKLKPYHVSFLSARHKTGN